jgi:hypothetical protein
VQKFSDIDENVNRAHVGYRESRDHTSIWRDAARTWFSMAAGDQWDSSDLARLQEQQRPAVVFNRILRTLSAVAGTQVSNRQEVRFIPREMGDAQLNEILTAAASWVRDECDAEDEESDAFRDMCITGMGWTETRLCYESDPDGKIIIDRTDPLEMYWDPSARKRNLSDVQWVMHVKVMDLDEFRAKWPDADPELAASPWEGAEDDTSRRSHVYPQDAYKASQNDKKRGGKARIRVAHIQWAKRHDVYRVGKRAESMEAPDFEKIRKKLEQHGIDHVRQPGVVWHRAFIAGGVELESGPCPHPDGPTFRCMTYERDHNANTWFGLVKAMVDPQRFGNKFFSQVLDILNKGSKGGIMVEADATDDMRELETKWARPDGVIKFRPGALSQGKIQEKPVVKLPTGIDRLMAFSLDAVHEVNGISLEFLGAADRAQAGVLERQRKQAGLTILAPLFDALRRYRKEQGRVLLHFIQEYISDGRLIRITGRDGNEQYIPLVRQPDVGRYDIIVDEAPTSPNMKERVYGVLVEMMPAISKMGIPLPPELLDYAPIPSVLAQKWKEQIAQSRQLPPEINDQMQKLVEENRELRSKREESVARINIEQAEAQAKVAMEQQQAVLNQQKVQAKVALEQRQVEADIGLEQRKAEQQLAIQAAKIDAERRKVEAEIEIERWKAEQQVAIMEQKTDTELELKRAADSNGAVRR